MISLISLKVLIVCVISLKNITSLNSLDELKPIVSAKELFSSSVYLESAIPKDSLKSAYSFNKSRRMFLENNEAFSSKSLGTDFKAVLNESFTSKGMIADWALHDKGDGNPHTHILLTVREVDSKKHWMSNRNLFLQTVGIKKADQSIIQNCHHIILKTKKQHQNIEYQNLMNMEIRKRESEKGKEQNIFGRKSQFPLMIGMIERMQKFGESLGQGIVINI